MNSSNLNYLHSTRCHKSSELTTLLDAIHPNELITVTESNKGYTVVWKSDKKTDERTRLTIKNWARESRDSNRINL